MRELKIWEISWFFNKIVAKKLFFALLIIILFLIFSWRLVVWSATLETARKTGYVSYVERALRDKNVFAKSIDRIFPEPSASLLNGILFGIRGDGLSGFFLDLQKAGMLHVIALSGQNISILIAVIVRLTGFLGKKMSILVSILGIFAFIMFVGPSASVVRAGVMGSLSLVALFFGRQYLALWGLLISGGIMVFIKPELLRDVGFQLSFLATFGIIIFSQRQAVTAKSFMERLIYDFRATFWTTVSAQIFTTPVIMANFGRFSVVSILTNVLVLWTVPIIMGLGFLAAVGGLVLMPIGLIVGFFCNMLLIYFVTLVTISASLPFATFEVGEFKLWMALVYYGIVFLFLAGGKWKRKKLLC